VKIIFNLRYFIIGPPSISFVCIEIQDYLIIRGIFMKDHNPYRPGRSLSVYLGIMTSGLSLKCLYPLIGIQIKNVFIQNAFPPDISICKNPDSH